MNAFSKLRMMYEFAIGEHKIRFHVSFFLLLLLVIGRGYGFVGVSIWMAVAFVSILVHELGHAYAAKRIGGTVEHIMLYGMGGITYWRGQWGNPASWRNRIFVSLAGPITGIVTGLVAYALLRSGAIGEAAASVPYLPWNVPLTLFARADLWVAFTLGAVVWVGFIWALFNLLPIGTLDGSKILGQILERQMPDGRGYVLRARIGMGFALAGAVWMFTRGQRFFALILIIMAANDFARSRGEDPPIGF